MGDIWVDVSVSMILEGEASSSKASMRSSLEAGSKTVSRSDKEMEVFMTSKSTLRARGWITKSCHEPSPHDNLQATTSIYVSLSKRAQKKALQEHAL